MLHRLAALVLVPVVLIGAGVTARAATDENAASFVRRANAERRERGLPAYAVRADLAAVATRHSARMAERSSLHHNPRLGAEVSGWEVVGENVGSGGTVESVHTAFMDSPTHRANILATDYTEIGVGTVTDDEGVVWVTQVFRLPRHAPRATAPSSGEAARTVVRVPIRPAPRRVATPARPPVAAPPPAAPLVAQRPDAAAFAGALAPAAAGDGPFARAMGYADALAALSR